MVSGLQSHDPLAVDEDRWLEALNRDWSAAYLISVSNDRWYGIRRDGSGNAIITATPGELAAAMGAAVAREHPATACPAADGRDIRDEIAMDELRAEPWAQPYDAGYADGAYRAAHLSGGALLTADSPEGLASAIKADIARRSAR